MLTRADPLPVVVANTYKAKLCTWLTFALPFALCHGILIAAGSYCAWYCAGLLLIDL